MRTGKIPGRSIARPGYEAVWNGQRSWNGVAILARGTEPVLTADSLPGDPADAQGRYIEAAVKGVLIGCIYLPNGNPQPGPKFDYKLAWFDRLSRTRPASRKPRCRRCSPAISMSCRRISTSI